MEIYSYPTDIANIVKGNWTDILMELAENNEKICLDNQNSMQPIIENKKYNFLQVDIGFFVWSLLTYMKKNLGNSPRVHDAIKLIEQDYSLDNESKELSRNLKHLVNLLTFYKLSSTPKKNAYSKLLYKNNLSGKYFYINSFILSKEVVGGYISKSFLEEKILKFATNKNLELIAYDRQISKFLDEERQNDNKISIGEFWNRKNGINKKILPL